MAGPKQDMKMGLTVVCRKEVIIFNCDFFSGNHI